MSPPSATRTALAAATSLAISAVGAIVAPAIALAEPKLTTTVFTGSPTGFLASSTLVAGDKDAILIDGQFDLADAHRLVAMIFESKKNLTTVYVTHWHPDHYFGLTAVHQAFPRAKLVALPGTVEQIRKTARAKVAQWGPMFGSLLPTDPVVPSPLAATTLTLEGQALEIHGDVQGDSPDNSYVWIPSIKTVIAGDIVYQGVHVWTAESTVAQRRAWRAALDKLAALNPTTVIAGHKDPALKDDPSGIAATRSYLDAFDAALASSKTAAELESKVKAVFPAAQLDVILHIGAGAAFPATK